jgi:hypothetical protein
VAVGSGHHSEIIYPAAKSVKPGVCVCIALTDWPRMTQGVMLPAEQYKPYCSGCDLQLVAVI